MLEADEVDIDLFTPVSSTSLSNIFSTTTDLDNSDNSSIKYVSKTSQNLVQNHDNSRATKIIYACAFYGYEWINTAYLSRGKLGAAIIKTLKSEQYNLLLYDTNKITLSCTNISTQLEVVVNEKSNISFYDNLHKFWSIYGTETEISSFINQLQSLNACVKKLANTEIDPIETNTCDVTCNQTMVDKDSDIDSSINIRTKDSILKRMASMGHSVLPIQATNFQNVEDSTDSDDSTKKVTRLKSLKNNINKKNTETMDVVDSSCAEINLHKKLSGISINPYDQLVPIKSTNIINNPVINNSSELNLFMSEQRINNSEICINVNRMTDKIDKILDSIQRTGDQLNNSVPMGFQNHVVQKLLSEYENKIKSYEKFFHSKGFDCSSILESQVHETLTDVDLYKSKIQELQTIIEEQKLENIKFRDELERLQRKYDILYKKSEENYDDHIKEVSSLNKVLESKNEEITNLSKIVEGNSLKHANEFETKLKSVMNRTFQSLSTNFGSSDTYTGVKVNSLIANVIKKETMEALKQVYISVPK